jgi:PKD repeat protein
VETSVPSGYTEDESDCQNGDPLNGSCTIVNTLEAPLPNDPPTASFTYSCTELSCSFNASASSDSDGSITGYSWNFGDGSSGSGVTTSHTYGAGQTYTVQLTVTDNDGATDSAVQNVTVSAPPSIITLSATGYKVKGRQKADLSWSGAATSSVDIYRDGASITRTANDGFHTDNIDRRGGGTYVYQVCEANTSVCSNEVTIDI